MKPSLRVMTYNVHSCWGTDRRLMPERILAVVREARPDIVALQEVDVGQSRSQGVDQAAFLAEGLKMEFHFAAARACHGGHYGNAVLSRLPILKYRSTALPQLHGRCEPRVVTQVRLDAPWGELDLLNVHFGLLRKERKLQVETLLGSDWLGASNLSPSLVVCGDFNAIPGSLVYRRVSHVLADAQHRRKRATFPARFPIFRLDHIFVSRSLSVRTSEVLGDTLARVASDHRPLVAEIEPASIPS